MANERAGDVDVLDGAAVFRGLDAHAVHAARVATISSTV